MLLISSSIASAAEEKAVEQKDIDKVVKALKGFKFGLLYYLSYQNGETGDLDNGTGYSQFTIKRGYFRVTKEILPVVRCARNVRCDYHQGSGRCR